MKGSSITPTQRGNTNDSLPDDLIRVARDGELLDQSRDGSIGRAALSRSRSSVAGRLRGRRPEQYFDYSLAKISLGDSFPNKAAWWADFKAAAPAATMLAGTMSISCIAARKRGTSKSLRSGLTPGSSRSRAVRPFRNWSRPSAWERKTSDRKGICSMPWRGTSVTSTASRFCNGTATRSAPDPDLTADGWVWDSYGWDSVSFRKHVMKFVALGKPAICVPWATDPQWPQWTKYPSAAALMDREWRQFDICREFNVSCTAFAVAGPRFRQHLDRHQYAGHGDVAKFAANPGRGDARDWSGRVAADVGQLLGPRSGRGSGWRSRCIPASTRSHLPDSAGCTMPTCAVFWT